MTTPQWDDTASRTSPPPGAAVVCRVAVLATGETIATRTDRCGTAVARAGRQELLGEVPLSPGIAVDAEDVVRAGSRAMTPEHLQREPSASARARSSPSSHLLG